MVLLAILGLLLCLCRRKPIIDCSRQRCRQYFKNIFFFLCRSPSLYTFPCLCNWSEIKHSPQLGWITAASDSSQTALTDKSLKKENKKMKDNFSIFFYYSHNIYTEPSQFIHLVNNVINQTELTGGWIFKHAQRCWLTFWLTIEAVEDISACHTPRLRYRWIACKQQTVCRSLLGLQGGNICVKGCHQSHLCLMSKYCAMLHVTGTSIDKS